MKLRNGFVSNSSSASFIVRKSFLTKEQIEMIVNYEKGARKLIREKKAKRGDFYLDHDWEIRVGTFYLEGYCTMDNFGMEEYLKLIGVPFNKFDYENDSYLSMFPSEVEFHHSKRYSHEKEADKIDEEKTKKYYSELNKKLKKRKGQKK